MKKLLIIFLMFSTFTNTFCQTLYDPEPPENAAFVRIANFSKVAISTEINSTKFDSIVSNSISPYRVVLSGKNIIKNISKSELDIKSKQFYTVVVDGTKNTLFLNDSKSPGLTKSGISVYNISKTSNISLKTGDGKISVIQDVAIGSMKSKFVNAIKVNLAIFVGDKKVSSLGDIQFERSMSYSAFFYGKPDNYKFIWLKNVTQK
jgi:alginate O-acetyltransferase complex protein AlgF